MNLDHPRDKWSFGFWSFRRGSLQLQCNISLCPRPPRVDSEA